MREDCITVQVKDGKKLRQVFITAKKFFTKLYCWVLDQNGKKCYTRDSASDWVSEGQIGRTETQVLTCCHNEVFMLLIIPLNFWLGLHAFFRPEK